MPSASPRLTVCCRPERDSFDFQISVFFLFAVVNGKVFIARLLARLRLQESTSRNSTQRVHAHVFRTIDIHDVAREEIPRGKFSKCSEI